MIRLFLLLLLCLAPISAQVTSLNSTHMHSVCPANAGSGAGLDAANYPFNTLCPEVIDAWSGAVADTKRNRLIVWGGGHTDYAGNEVYALSLTGTPSWSRLTNPSPWNIVTYNGTCIQSAIPTTPLCTVNADGTPVISHTYGSLQYLPTQDVMFTMPTGPLWQASSESNQTWTLSLSSNTWTLKSPVNGYDPVAHGDAVSVTGGMTAYDPVSQSVFVTTANNAGFYKYDPATNTVTRLVSAGNFTYAYAASAAIDPIRRQMWFIGRQGAGAAAIQWVDISGADTAYTVHDVTSSFTGCSAMTTVNWPGFDYDTARNKFVGWPNSGQDFIIIDPATYTCTTVTPGGDSIAAGTVNGTFGRLAYFPSLGYHVLVNSADNNAYKIALDATPSSGLGAYTVTCIDADGDGYGVGPGCTGADADDADASVHTAAQGIAKYATFAAFVQHLGYNPTRLWYLSTSGNDGTCAVGTLASPPATACATWGHIVTAGLTGGDMVMARAGTWTGTTWTLVSGTAGNPVILKAYPGEQPFVDNRGTTDSIAIDLLSKSWVVIDGIKAAGGLGNSGCIGGGGSTSHVTILRTETTECTDGGIDAFDGLSEWFIQGNVMHTFNTPYCGSCQHALYMGSRTNPSSNIYIGRNLMYNPQSGYPAFQFNGRVTNLLVDQNMIYGTPGNSAAGFLQGVSSSRFTNNLLFNNGGGFQLSNYDGDCYNDGSSGICPYAQTGNMIANNTIYVGNDPEDGTISPKLGLLVSNSSTGCYPVYGALSIHTGSHAWDAGHNYTSNAGVNNQPSTHPSDWTDNGACALTKQGSVGSNTYANNLIVASYRPIRFQMCLGSEAYVSGTTCTLDTADTSLSTSTFLNNDIWVTQTTPTSNVLYLPPTPYGTPSGIADLNGGKTAAGSTGNINVDPAFLAASPSYWNTPASFNFSVSGSSPGSGTGAASTMPLFDTIGALRSSVSMGALNPNGGAAAVGGSNISGKSRVSGNVVR